MMKLVHCWWCGRLVQVDTEQPFSGGMVRDSDTSWLCDDDPGACAARMAREGSSRNRHHDHSECHP
jgi:hypothetical protein